jgi:hypothetical protein
MDVPERDVFLELHDRIADQLRGAPALAVPYLAKTLAAGSDSRQTPLAAGYGTGCAAVMNQGTVMTTVKQVCALVASLQGEFIRPPSTEEEITFTLTL